MRGTHRRWNQHQYIKRFEQSAVASGLENKDFSHPVASMPTLLLDCEFQHFRRLPRRLEMLPFPARKPLPTGGIVHSEVSRSLKGWRT